MVKFIWRGNYMDNRNDFLILDDDEKIVYTYKPNKTRIWFSNLLWSIVLALINIGIGLMFVFIPGEDGTKPPFEVFYIFLAISLVVVVLTIIFTSTYYKKRVYAVTNKRVIIRGGVIGVDYKSLDLKMIGALNVYVDFIDKVLRQDTGTLRFGSMASPLGSNQSPFSFKGIKRPYEVYKEIRVHMDKVLSEEQ